MFDHGIGGTEAIILLVIVLVVFGSKRLPDSARSLGQSLRILKAETRGLRDAPPAEQVAASATGELVQAPVARFDPMTGEPLARFDPMTGAPLAAGGRPKDAD